MPEPRAGDRFATILFYGAVFLLLYLVFRIFQPFLVPLGWAGVFVVFFYPWHMRLEKRFGPTRGAALSTLLVTLILIVPALLVMTAFVREGIEAARHFEQVRREEQTPIIAHLQQGWEWLRQRIPLPADKDPAEFLRQSAQAIGGFLALRAGAVLKNIAIFFFDLFVLVFAMFFLFRDAGSILAGLRSLLPFDEAHRERMMMQSRDLIFASVTASLIVAVVQGAVGGLAFAILGIGSPVFWGVIMAFFSLVPLLGTWIIWVPASIWLMVDGHLWKGIALLVVGAGVVSSVDNFLRPWLLTGRAQLNALLVFIGVLGGISVFGLLGLVLGPIVIATAAGALQAYRQGENTG